MQRIKYILIVILVAGLAWWFLANYNSKPVVETPEVINPPQHVAENPEGEADPDRMTLDMTVWRWIKANYNDGSIIVPKKEVFTLAFKKDGTFSYSTDCNGGGGQYAVTAGKQITFSKIMSTLMACGVGSQEGDFTKILENTSSYFFTSRGELILELKYDSGTATFR